VNQWTFFSFVYQSIDTAFLGAVQTNVSAFIAALQMPALLLTTVYIALEATKILYGDGGANPMLAFVKICARASIMLGLLGAANYTSLFVQLALQTLPTEMMTVFGGATGTGITSPQGVFDAFLQSGWVSVVEVWKNIGWSPKAILAALMAAMLFAIGSVCVCIGFIIYLASHIMLGLAVIVGPLFVVFVLLPQTASLFASWLTTLLSLVLTQTMISILLAVLRDTAQQILNQIVAISGTASGSAGEYANDLGAQIHLYDEMVLLYFIIGGLSAAMPVLAGTLARSAAPGIASFAGAVQGAVGTAARQGVAMAARVGPATSSGLPSNGAAGLRSIRPVGKAVG
jgi:hypothetical protein